MFLIEKMKYSSRAGRFGVDVDPSRTGRKRVWNGIFELNLTEREDFVIEAIHR